MATPNLECIVDTTWYQVLHDVISQSITSLSKDTINAIISYLCYYEFYFGTKCKLNIKSRSVTFNLFDIHGRICYKLQSPIVNYNKIKHIYTSFKSPQENKNSKSSQLMEATFIGDYNSCKLHNNSLFILQVNTITLLMSWKINTSHSQIPTIHYIKTLDNISRISRFKQRMMILMQQSLFIFLSKRTHTYSTFIELRHYQSNYSSIHAYPYNKYGRVGRSARGSRRAYCCEPVLINKAIMTELLGDNLLFRDNVKNMVNYCDYFVFDVCQMTFEHIAPNVYYINIAGINKQLHTVDSLGKIWFKEKKIWGSERYEIKCMKMMKDNKLFMVYSDEKCKTLCAGTFVITENNINPPDVYNILRVMECRKEITICNNFYWSNTCMATRCKIVSDPCCESDAIVLHMCENKSVLHEYVIDKDLKVINTWKSDLFGRDYMEYWHGKFCVDYSVEIVSNDFILGPENDVNLRSDLKSKDMKKIVTEWGIFIGFIGGVSVVGSLCAAVYKRLFG